MLRKMFIVLICLLLVSMISMGCEGAKDTADDNKTNKTRDKLHAESQTPVKLNPDIQGTVSILVSDSNFFIREYEDFYLKYPDVKVDLINAGKLWSPTKPIAQWYEEIEQLIETEKPDVVWFQNMDGLYEKLANEEKLLDLAPYLKKDNFDLEPLNPHVIEALKNNKKGRLYGLSPVFDTSALFYNKELFSKYNIDFPEDDMSWEDIMQIAKRFPSKGMPGIHADDPYMSLLKMWVGKSKYLIDMENNRALIDTEWNDILKYVLELYESEALYKHLEKDRMFSSDAGLYNLYIFFHGKAPMAIGSRGLLSHMDRAKLAIKDLQIPEWDVVNLPGSKPDPIRTFSINAASAQSDLAWEFIKFVNSENLSYEAGFPTRGAHFEAGDGTYNIDAFYSINNSDINDRDKIPLAERIANKIPGAIDIKINTIFNEEFDEVILKKKSIDDAIRAIQRRVQEVWTNR